MCGLFALASNELNGTDVAMLLGIIERTRERGSDAVGLAIRRPFDSKVGDTYRSFTWNRSEVANLLDRWLGTPVVIIGNVRAEPTTEWFGGDLGIEQLHPFETRGWSVVHNGTIANDAALRDGSENSPVDSAVLPTMFAEHGFLDGIQHVVGSYAVLALEEAHPELLRVATNYKPMYEARRGSTLFLSSQARFMPGLVSRALPEYTAHRYSMRTGYPTLETTNGLMHEPLPGEGTALAILSGGLDSTVALGMAVHELGAEHVRVLHFEYGCRAQQQEVESVNAICDHYGIPVEQRIFLNVESLFATIASTSPLIDRKATIRTDGDAGAEYAYEWVPARNTVFLALATALAENIGAQWLFIGTNLEESGAYPDNEPEFINRFNHLLPYAVGDGKYVRVRDVCGNMMKHMIVKTGLQYGVPLSLTWSCYNGDTQQCGQCGPCKMRQVAFRMNGEHDPIEYAAPVA